MLEGEYKIFAGEALLGTAVLTRGEHVLLMGHLMPSPGYHRFREIIANWTVISCDLNQWSLNPENFRELALAVERLSLNASNGEHSFKERVTITDISLWADEAAPIVVTVAKSAEDA